MVKKVLLVVILIILAGVVIHLTMKKEFDNLEWVYKVKKKEKIEYILEKNNILVVSTVKDKNSFIDIINKDKGKNLANIKLNPIQYPPVISENALIVASSKSKDSDTGDLTVIDLNNGDLILKEQYAGNKWPFIVEGKSLFYVDISGSLRNIEYESKKIIWKILSDNRFKDSTKPLVSNNSFFICNNNQILALDLKTSEVLYNFKADSKILSCSFDNNTAVVSMENEYIYAIDLLSSRVRWKYKFVSLYSKVLLEIVNSNYLLILNTVNFKPLVETKRAKVLSSTRQVLHIINLNDGRAKWQKQFKYTKNPFSFSDILSNSTIILPSITDSLTAYFIDTGLKQWDFFSKEKTPITNYVLRYDKVFLIKNYKESSYVYILKQDDGRLLGTFKISQGYNKRFNPVVDENNIYIVYQDNTIKAFKIPSLNKDR